MRIDETQHDILETTGIQRQIRDPSLFVYLYTSQLYSAPALITALTQRLANS